MYDVIVIGAGPAGISASLYVKRSNLKVLVLYNGRQTNLEKAPMIDNYYGFPGGISGTELYQNGLKQAKDLGIELRQEEVVEIVNCNQHFQVKTVKNSFDSKTVILATGNQKIKPNIPGIQEFEGKGISYCAICDAFFYQKKNVAVIGNGPFAINQAKELSPIVNKITILTDGLEPPEGPWEVNTKKIKAIVGEDKVKQVEFEDGTSLAMEGIFIALGEAGASDFAKTLGILQEKEKIKVNEKMETNVPGVFACGNVTGGLLQICKAVYEGAQAGLSSAEYVRNIEEKEERK